MNVVREVQKLNEEELRRGVPASASWHAEYARSAWVYVGGLAPELSEGDVICVLSQWGEVEDVHLVRDEATGRSKGFCFLKYEDARSSYLEKFCPKYANITDEATLMQLQVQQFTMQVHKFL
jgi:RNA-binding motif X-linked protein 2